MSRRRGGMGYTGTRRFGGAKAEVSEVGQGTWYIESKDREAAVRALRKGLDLGMNHIDTAEMYGSGAAETIIAEAIDGRRNEVFLVSKVLPENASQAAAMKACEKSLARLQTDRLDCYLLHWRGRHPLDETVTAFDKLQRQGKILSWGVSNFDVGDLNDLLQIADEGSIACNQVLYHLKERAIEHAVLPWCKKHSVSVVAYSPFGHGSFPSPRSRGGHLLAELAAAHGATPRQIALSFLLRWPTLFTIPKASTAEHAEENAAASNVSLTGDDVRRLNEEFPLGPRPAQLPML